MKLTQISRDRFNKTIFRNFQLNQFCLSQSVKKPTKMVSDRPTLTQFRTGSENIKFIDTEILRKKAAKFFGLPKSTSWDKMYDINHEKRRIADAKKLGLPENTPWEEINVKYAQRQQGEFVKELGLPEDASWVEIHRAKDEKYRIEFAQQLGLPENTPWSDMYYIGSKIKRLAMARRLGLPKSASWDDIIRRIEDAKLLKLPENDSCTVVNHPLESNPKTKCAGFLQYIKSYFLGLWG